MISDFIWKDLVADSQLRDRSDHRLETVGETPKRIQLQLLNFESDFSHSSPEAAQLLSCLTVEDLAWSC